jgi:hypothetical protein
MRTQTKAITLGIVVIVLLSSIVLVAVFADVEGPTIYQIDILPTAPASGDDIIVTVYCIDSSGISGAQLFSSINGEDWETADMSFYACLCLAGGRWTASFGPLYEGDVADFFVRATDDSVRANSADTQVHEVQIGA